MNERLTALQMAVLEFERDRWKHLGARDEAIRVWFGTTPTTYHEVLLQALRSPAAEVYDPALVRRLRRRLEQLRAQRPNRTRGATA